MADPVDLLERAAGFVLLLLLVILWLLGAVTDEPEDRRDAEGIDR